MSHCPGGSGFAIPSFTTALSGHRRRWSGVPVVARDAVDVTVPPLAVAEVMTAQAAFAQEAGSFESALLGDVLHFGAQTRLHGVVRNR